MNTKLKKFYKRHYDTIRDAGVFVSIILPILMFMFVFVIGMKVMHLLLEAGGGGFPGVVTVIAFVFMLLGGLIGYVSAGEACAGPISSIIWPPICAVTGGVIGIVVSYGGKFLLEISDYIATLIVGLLI